MLRSALSGDLKTLISSPSPHHLLVLRSPVSGTAKGKSKLKDGAPLKRSVITRKKPAAAAGSGSGAGGGGPGRGRKEIIERLSRMADSCLNAPTPIRHLTAKERHREAEREKLGLISKDRQRELDQLKARSKGKNEEEEEPFVMGTPGLDYVTLGLVDKEKIPKYELTVEDGRRLAKEYSRFLMRKHRARQAAETGLLNSKKEAIAALPEGPLRAAAMVPDYTPFPANRFMATLTPPIEGYAEKVNEAAKKHSVKEKLR